MKLIQNNKELTEFPVMPNGLTELSLFNNKIIDIPNELWDKTTLQVLNISMNKIQEISSKIGDLVNLNMIDFGHNQIRIIPKEIGDLKALDSYLYLHNNRLDHNDGIVY